MWAVLQKELKQTARLLPIGWVIAAIACYLSLPNRQSPVVTMLLPLVGMVSGICAFALGILQAAPDLNASAFAYLHHRAVSRSNIFWAKTGAGAIIYALAFGMPLAATAIWLSAHGLQDYPVRPAQVLPTLEFVVSCFALHSAATLILARRASWPGTRAYPLLGVATAIFMQGVYLKSNGLHGAVFCMPITCCVLAWTLHAARNAWCHLANEPQKVNAFRAGWSVPAYLAVGAVVVMIFIVACIGALVEQRTVASRGYAGADFVDAQTGDVWISYYSRLGEELDLTRTRVVRLARNVDIDTVEPMAGVPPTTKLSPMLPAQHGEGVSFYNSDGFFALDYRSLVYDCRGYVLKYVPIAGGGWRLVSIYDRTGRHSADHLPTAPFARRPNWLWSGRSVFALDDAIVQEDSDNGKFIKLIDAPPDWVAYAAEETAPTELLIGTGDEVRLYRLSATSNAPAAESAASDVSAASDRELLTAELVRTIRSQHLPKPSVHTAVTRVAMTDVGFTVTGYSYDTQQRFVMRIDNDGNLVEQFEIRNSSSKSATALVMGVLGLMPPVVLEAADLYQMGLAIANGQRPVPLSLVNTGSQAKLTIMAVMLTSVAVAIGITLLLGRRYGLSNRKLAVWVLATCGLGLAGPLALLAIYPAVIIDSCPSCRRPRVVTSNRCDECGADWLAPTQSGIELVDTER
ncbi:MAG: hypothetical protein KDB23_21995, partial [Planctomycetales bacterium]|nr:hypothetical protein [Planctomycetales bacterium]